MLGPGVHCDSGHQDVQLDIEVASVLLMAGDSRSSSPLRTDLQFWTQEPVRILAGVLFRSESASCQLKCREWSDFVFLSPNFLIGNIAWFSHFNTFLGVFSSHYVISYTPHVHTFSITLLQFCTLFIVFVTERSLHSYSCLKQNDRTQHSGEVEIFLYFQNWHDDDDYSETRLEVWI